MTPRIDALFDDARQSARRVLVAYLCVGFPTIDESIELAVAAVEAGADALELGVPFSDPTADGPAIARASEKAIARGATLDGILTAAAALRARVAAPLVLFTYYNPILVMGEAVVVKRAAAAGIDALLVVDLPPEEAGSLRALAADAGLALVPLVAPTTPDARAASIASALDAQRGAPRGFIYYVSMTGVTGSGANELANASARAAALRARYRRPVVVGFGIDSGATARTAAGSKNVDGPDGIVVGSAVVRAIEAGATVEGRLARLRALVAELRTALDTD